MGFLKGGGSRSGRWMFCCAVRGVDMERPEPVETAAGEVRGLVGSWRRFEVRGGGEGVARWQGDKVCVGVKVAFFEVKTRGCQQGCEWYGVGSLWKLG